MPVLVSDYVSPKWLVGAHMQTIIPARFFPRPQVEYRRETVDMPDGDFMVFDWVVPEPARLDAPVLVHFHGLEGDSRSHYAEALMHHCVKKGWRGVVAHFRGCGGLPNRLPRAYFAGDSADCCWALKTVHAHWPAAPMYAVGVSLGGNQLAKYVGEAGATEAYLTAAASICAPLDLVAGSEVMNKGANKLYADMFLATLKEKLIDKARRFPDLFDLEAAKACAALYDFDSLYTAPVHHFKSAMEYWTVCSAKPYLSGARKPLLVLNAKNDPFLPAWALPGENEVSADVWLEYADEGGHVGFGRGSPPGDLGYLPERIFTFFSGFDPRVAPL